MRFLGLLHPGGPWLLTAIASNGSGHLYTRVARSAEDVATFVEDATAEKFDCYYTLNPVFDVSAFESTAGRRSAKMKPQRSDIAALAWFHVDLDPRAGENLASERARAGELLESHDPKPTFIVSSGGGLQAGWRLDEPLQLNGTREMAEYAAQWSRHLELTLGADSCHNVDRLMRLPGSVNWANTKKKRAAGRTPSNARLVMFDATATVSLGDQPRAAPQASPTDVGTTTDARSRPHLDMKRLPKLGGVEDLGPKVPEKVRRFILSGPDPNSETEMASPIAKDRSRGVFWVACELLRAEVPERLVAAALLDSRFYVSAHVQEQDDPLRAVERALAHARESLPVEPGRGVEWLRSASVSVAELLEERPEPPASILGDGLLPVGALALLSGAPGLGKTWAMIDLALSLGSAEAWLDAIPTGEEPRRVGLAMFEVPSPFLWQRAHAVHTRREFPSEALTRVDVLTPDRMRAGALDVLEEHHYGALVEWARDFDLVVMDALQRTHMVNENSADEMGKVLRAYDELRREAGCAVLLVHHTRKPGEGAGRDLDAARGSTRLQSDPQLVMLLKRSMGRLALAFPKCNYARDPGEIWLRQTESGPLEPGEPPDSRARPARLDKVVEFIASCGGERVTTSEVVAFFRGRPKKRTVEQYLAELADTGRIVVHKGPRGGKAYTLPNEGGLELPF